jgi:hypothetical protein
MRIIRKSLRITALALTAFNLAAYPIGYEAGKVAQIRMINNTSYEWKRELFLAQNKLNKPKYLISRIGSAGFIYGAYKNSPSTPKWI